MTKKKYIGQCFQSILSVCSLVILVVILTGCVVETSMPPPTQKVEDKPINVEPAEVKTPVKEPVEQKKETKKIEVVSTSFDDFGDVYCDFDSTSLQKDVLFEDEFEGNYVTWTGTVASVTKESNKFVVGVRHCETTLVWDVDVTLRDTEKTNAIALNEGDEVTYTAKLTSDNGLVVELKAKDGIIIT